MLHERKQVEIFLFLKSSLWVSCTSKNAQADDEPEVPRWAFKATCDQLSLCLPYSSPYNSVTG